MKKTFHIDCTLRDGGYYNSWNFEDDLVNKYLDCMDKLKVDFVEIGFRFLKDTKNLGPYASTSEKFLNSLKLPKKLKLAVMINIGEFNFDKLAEELNSLFVLKKKSKISLIRIATHKKEIDLAIKASKILKQKGYQTAINLMQISEIKNFEIKKILKKINFKYLDVFYFADSLGCLTQQQTGNICRIIKKFCKKPFGIHAHDNTEIALQNTIHSYKNGASYLDSTILGMGRGPGNTKTELLCSYLKINKIKDYNILFLTELVDNYFLKLKNKYKWGTNLYYYLSAQYKIHPTYIQMMLSDKRYDENEMLLAIENLRKQKSKTYNPIIYKNSKNFFKKLNLKKINNNIFNNKEILVLGNSISLKTYREKINNFIKKKNPIIVSLNLLKENDLKLIKKIDYLAICHPTRILSEVKSIPISKKLIIPFSSFSNELQRLTKNFKRIDYGIKIEENKINFFKSYCIINKILVLTYLLSLLYASGSKSITFAGLDGYKDNLNSRKENNKILKKFKFKNKKISINFLTPTYYKI